MSSPLSLLLVALPTVCVPLVCYAVRPDPEAPAPVRLALARAALLLGGYGVGSVEVLSAFGALTRTGVLLTWLVALVAAGLAAVVRRRRDAPGGRLARPLPMERWYTLARVDRILVAATAALILGELALALVSPPNTYDSQTYHLPKIEHWADQHNVEFYPVRIHRQVTYAPGAEYLLLHLRLLTGGDALYGLLQWACGLLVVVLVTRITAQLGGGRRAQVLAAFVLASTPAVVLESSSTQTDLVVAAWVACLATLVLDTVRTAAAWRPALVPTVVLFGTATGLIAVTKQTGLFVAAPLLVWWGLARLRAGREARRLPRTVLGVATATVVVLGLTAAITGPFVWRVYTEFGHPLGPDYLRNSITMQRHDPAAVLVNGARQAQSLFDTPIPVLSAATASGVDRLAHLVGIDPSDPAITFDNATFPDEVWYPSEDKAAYPIQAAVMVISVLACLFAAHRGRRAYAAVLLAALLVHTVMVKWQPWGNRLFLYVVVLAAPLAGIVLARLVPPSLTRRSLRAMRGRAWVAGLVSVALFVGGVAGGLSVLYGWPRRLVGGQSVFVLDDWNARFVTRPAWAAQYAEVGAVVRASGARRIGVVQQNDSWEYPWWLVLKGDGRQLIAVQSQLIHHRPEPNPRLDAIVCAGPENVCREWSPVGWQIRMYGVVGWSLPPDRAPTTGP